MPSGRNRRIVRCAVIALVLGLGLAWIATREPPEIQQSRALRIGMAESEVDAVMGRPQVRWRGPVNGRGLLTNYYGRSTERLGSIYNNFGPWLGLPRWKIPHGSYPVRVRFDGGSPKNRVELIERGDQVEPQQ